MRNRYFFFGRLILPAVFVSYSPSAHALTKLNNTNALNSATSWAEGTVPTSTDVLLFDSSGVPAALTVAVGGSATMGSLQFTTIGGNVTITQSTGNTWTLASGGIDMSAATADVTIGASGRFLRWANGNYGGMSVAAGRTLTINSAFSNQGNTKTLALTGPGNIIFNSTAGGGGAMSFNVTGSANVTMNGAGSWSGGTVTDGTLNLGIDSALGGITLNLGGTASSTPTVIATGGARTISNNINLLNVTTGSATIAGSNALTINGAVTNSGGNRTLSVNNSALTTLGGLVNLSENATNRTLTVNGTGDTVISGVVGNGGTSTVSGLTYSGSGTLSLSNANTFGGSLTQSSGTVRLDNSLAAQNATVNVGTTNGLAFGTGITNATVAALTGSNIALTNSDTNGVNLSVGNGNVGSTYAGVLGGAGSLTKIGSGTMVLSSGGQSYTGSTSVSGGTLQFTGSGNTQSNLIGAGSLNLSNGGRVRFNSTGGANVNNAVDVGTGGGTLSFRGNSTLSATAMTGTGTLTLDLDNGVTLTPNTLNGFGGTVNVSTNGTGATFRMSASFDNSSLGNAKLDLGAGISLNRNAGTSGSITTSIGTLSGASTSSIGGSSGGGGTFTFSVGSRNEDSTYAGSIVDGGTKTAFTKVGSGTQTLSGTSTYTGATTVSAGTLLVNGALGATATAVNGTAILGGTGSIGGPVTVGSSASIAAGNNGIGSLGLNSAILNGTLLTQLDGTGAGGIDALNVTGSLDITNGIVNFSTLGIAPDDTSYVFATYGSLAGSSFASVLNLPTGYTIDYAFGGTNSIALVAIPEPASVMLGALGLLALLRRRRD